MTFEVEIKDKKVLNALDKKSREAKGQIEKYKKRLLNIYENWAIREAPRKTGNLKSKHHAEWHGDIGLVWVDEREVPYIEPVIKGSKPHIIRAKKAKALGPFMFSSHLGVSIGGYIGRNKAKRLNKGVRSNLQWFKSVRHPGTRPNPYPDRAIVKGNIERTRLDKQLIDWMVDLT